MALLITIIFCAVWYVPLLVKHRKLEKAILPDTEREPFKWYVFAFLLGCAAFVAALIIQTLFSNLIANVKLTGAVREIFGFFKIMIAVATVEETVKFLAGYLILRNKTGLTEVATMLIMAAAGVGFELFESALNTNAIAAIARGVFALHILWQLVMGKFWYRARQAKAAGNTVAYKKNLAIAFGVPIISHGLFDYPVLKVQALQQENVAVSDFLKVFLLCLSLAVGIVYAIFAVIAVARTMKAEKAVLMMRATGLVSEDDADSREPLYGRKNLSLGRNLFTPYTVLWVKGAGEALLRANGPATQSIRRIRI